jgi:hypothetical protein
MKDLFKVINKLCLPAQLYLAISTISILALLFQNMNTGSIYCIGHMKAHLPCNKYSVFIFQIFYVIIWTWILQKLCSKGYKSISWLLVLLPFVMMFLMLILMIFQFHI